MANNDVNLDLEIDLSGSLTFVFWGVMQGGREMVEILTGSPATPFLSLTD